MTAIDKSSWPKVQPLPADLPKPARVSPAKYGASSGILAGHWADDAHSAQSAVGQPDAFGAGRLTTKYAGRDARAALAAAVEAARAVQPWPAFSKHTGAPAQTFVGVYHTNSGAFLVEPLFGIANSGTNWMDDWCPTGSTFAASPDMRFRFHDDHLAAVVTSDGFIVNPDAHVSF